MPKSLTRVFAALAVAGVVSGCAAVNAKGPAIRPSNPVRPTDTVDSQTGSKEDLLTEIFNLAVKRHVLHPDPASLRGKGIKEMLESLDPHSKYHPPVKTKDIERKIQGSYGGVGIIIDYDNSRGLVRIVSPIEDTPAQKAGLRAGDYITHINGEPMKGKTMDDNTALMRGPVDTDVILTIERGGKRLPDITISRAKIVSSLVKGRVIGNDVGYARVKAFEGNTAGMLEATIKGMKAEMGANVKGYVIDLRGNPGGLLGQSVTISDMFLESGTIVSVGTGAPDDRVYSALPGDLTDGKPVILLTDGGSASASEIVAGALQDYGRAMILGTQTFGKGSVQSLIPLKNGGMLRLTTGHYFTPSGNSIQGKGVTPDIEFIPLKRTRLYTKELRLKNTLVNPQTGADTHKTTQTCKADTSVDTARMDRRMLDVNGDPDYQLACAVEILRGQPVYTITAPVAAP